MDHAQPLNEVHLGVAQYVNSPKVVMKSTDTGMKLAGRSKYEISRRVQVGCAKTCYNSYCESGQGPKPNPDFSQRADKSGYIIRLRRALVA